MTDLKIDVQDLHKSFGKNEVLKGIDVQFNEGDVVCIIGPSGSGKSTFLRTLNLLETVTSGKVIVDGYELSDPSTNVDKALLLLSNLAENPRKKHKSMAWNF